MTSLSEIKPKSITLLIAICFFTLAANYLFAQIPESNFQDIKTKLQTYSEIEKHEVLYLHTNGNTFSPGDTLWFKAYNLRAGKLNPSGFGALLLVNLYDFEGNKIIDGKFKLIHGTANGQFELPDSLSNGKYFLTAGSNFTVSNFQEDIFAKEINIRKTNKQEVMIKISIPDTVYSEQNIIQGKLEVIGDKYSKLAQVKVKLELKQEQNVVDKEIINTGKEGTGTFEFLIPENLENKALTLYAEPQQSGLEANLTVSIPIGSIPPTIRFFPEGGKLIQGIDTKVAFEATDISGNAFDFSGIIIDSNGHVITNVSTNFSGMGSVNILSQDEEKLFLQIKEPKGYSKKYEIPQAVNSGYSLHIHENTSDIITLAIESNEIAPNDSVSLLVFLRNKVFFATTRQLQELQNFSIPVKNMPMGVAKITVFDFKGIPKAERLAFLHQNKRLNIKHRGVKTIYERKEKVEIGLTFQNNFRDPVSGLFSLSVSPVYPGNDFTLSDNIMVSLLLSNELKGEIPAKGFYFSGNPGAKEALDLLMLTHGWRKFSWETIYNLDKIKLERRNILQGKVSLKNGKPVKNGDVTLMNFRTFYAITTSTNNDGYFYFSDKELVNMLDDGDLTLTATGRGGSKRVILKTEDLNSTEKFAHFITTSKNKKLNTTNNSGLFSGNGQFESDTTGTFTNTYYSDLTQRNIWVEDVQVQAKRPVVIPIEVFEKQYQYYEKGEDEIHINLGNNDQTGILQLIHEVAGNFKVADGGKIMFRGVNSLYAETMQGAIFVVNGRLVGFSYYDVNHLNSGDIENIRVTKSSAAGLKYSSYASGGLIEITTKTAKMRKTPSAPLKMEQNVLSIAGFGLVRDFYSPVYKNEEQKKQTIDLRTTLFWEPNLTIDNSGKALLQYFNSDIPGEYELRIEGLSKSGDPAYLIKRYSIIE